MDTPYDGRAGSANGPHDKSHPNSHAINAWLLLKPARLYAFSHVLNRVATQHQPDGHIMNRDEIFLFNSEIEIRRRAAKIRAEFLRELASDLGKRVRAAVSGRKAQKNGHKIGKVGGATA